MTRTIWSVVILYAFYSISNADEACPILFTPLGKMIGSTLESRLGKTIYSYRGIRYAQAPVGQLRFKVVRVLL